MPEAARASVTYKRFKTTDASTGQSNKLTLIICKDGSSQYLKESDRIRKTFLTTAHSWEKAHNIELLKHITRRHFSVSHIAPGKDPIQEGLTESSSALIGVAVPQNLQLCPQAPLPSSPLATCACEVLCWQKILLLIKPLVLGMLARVCFFCNALSWSLGPSLCAGFLVPCTN